MGRLGRGWTLTRESWAVVRNDRSLLVFPVVAGVCALVAAGAIVAVGALAAGDTAWILIVFAVVALYVVIAIGQFCAVALAACATKSLDGADTTFSEGISAARERLGVILAWSGVQLVVGSLISALQALLRDAGAGIAAAIIGGLANLAWTVATFFVVPLIALEGLGPKAAISRSSELVRKRWGEGVVGTATIGGAVFLVGILPGIGVAVLGWVLIDSVAALGVALIVIGACVVVLALLVQATLSAVFRVALYRFATRADVTGHFSEEQLSAAFRPRKGAAIA
jgi:hypothetical protein